MSRKNQGGRKQIAPGATATGPDHPKRLRPLAAVHATSDDREDRRPVWSFSLVDHAVAGEWSWAGVGGHASSLFPFLSEMERLTWREIRQQRVKAAHGHSRPKHHGQAVETLPTTAQRRLAEIELDDVTELFRFRLDGTSRLWGVHVPGSSVFCLLWWDPDHRVYPVD